MVNIDKTRIIKYVLQIGNTFIGHRLEEKKYVILLTLNSRIHSFFGLVFSLYLVMFAEISNDCEDFGQYLYSYKCRAWKERT